MGDHFRESIRVHGQLIQIALKRKKGTFLRYWLALKLMDKDGGGRLSIEQILEVLPSQMGVTRKTIQNNLYRLRDAEWIYFSEDNKYIHLRSYESVSEMLGQPITNKRAVLVTAKDLSGNIVEVRAFLEDCLLAFLGKDKVTITRKKRKELGGRGIRTQRKYERIRKIEKRQNLVIGPSHNLDYNLERAIFDGRAAFIYTDENNDLNKGSGARFVAWLAPNTYFPTVNIVRKPCRTLNYSRDAVNATRLFYDDPTKAMKAWNKTNQETDIFYLEKERFSGFFGVLEKGISS